MAVAVARAMGNGNGGVCEERKGKGVRMGAKNIPHGPYLRLCHGPHTLSETEEGLPK